MTTAFEHRWNVTLQASHPDMIDCGVVVLQKSLAKVIPSPLALPLSAAYLLHPTSSDLEILVDLMRSAYDLPDESLPALRMRLHSYFSAGDADPLLDSSWMCFLDGRPISACLMAMPRGGQVPHMVDLMTIAPWQKHGLATAVLEKSFHALVENGFSSVQLTCYAADLPVIQKLEQFGFVPVENLAQ